MRFRLVSLPILLLLLSSCQTEHYELRFHTQTQKTERFVIESQIKLILQGGQTAPEALGSTLTAWVHSSPVVSYDDGSARFLLEVDSASYRSEQRSVEECSHIERSLLQQEFQYKIAPHGEMQDLRMNEFVPELENTDIDLRRVLLKIQPVLPGTPVKVGDTWERQQPLDDGPQAAIVYKWFQVDEAFTHQKKQLVKLRMNIKYKLNDSTSAEVRLQGNDFIIGSGDVLFNVTDGQIDDAVIEVNGSLNVLMNQTSHTPPPMQVRQIVHMRRLK